MNEHLLNDVRLEAEAMRRANEFMRRYMPSPKYNGRVIVVSTACDRSPFYEMWLGDVWSGVADRTDAFAKSLASEVSCHG